MRMSAFTHLSFALTLAIVSLTAASLAGLAGCDQITGATGAGADSSAASEASQAEASLSEAAVAEAAVSDSMTTSDEGSASAVSSVAEASSSSVPALPDFPHADAGVLLANSGSGYTDTTNWAPGICFPLAQTPDYANSQVYNPGGDHYPSTSASNHGSQCDSANYAYPWHDTFCEARSWTNPVCKSGQGHQGQDIRPSTCKKDTWWAVAAEDGTITQIGSYTVGLTGDATPHRIFRYLHMQVASIQVKLGDHVKRGQKLGLVSNNFGTSNGVPQYTTIHLHFEVRVAQAETMADGTKLAANAFVPPYTALVDAYQRKLGGDCPTVN